MLILWNTYLQISVPKDYISNFLFFFYTFIGKIGIFQGVHASMIHHKSEPQAEIKVPLQIAHAPGTD